MTNITTNLPPCKHCGSPSYGTLPNPENEEEEIPLCARCGRILLNTCPCGCEDPEDPAQCVYAKQHEITMARIAKEKQMKQEGRQP